MNKKKVIIILSIIVVLSIGVTVYFTCFNNNDDTDNATTTTEEGLENAANEFYMDTIEVTDENGETVTDKNGNAVTTDVFMKYEKDENGKTIAVQIDEDGEAVTDKDGNKVTHKTDYDPFTTTTPVTDGLPSEPSTKPTTASTTMKPVDSEKTTSAELTTLKPENERVPKTSESGSTVKFSSEDQQTIKEMLEVPYLYTKSYENSDGVPIEVATHTAIWMARREGFNTTSYASATIVLDLFKYYAQTVVNFKTYCNDAGNSNITYKSSNDTFVISSFEAPTHSVTLNKIEYLGNNNYYKVTGTVSGTNKASKVVAVIQKNRLDSSLGFSVKAIKWS